MTKQECHHVYGQSVFEIRLEVAIRLLSVSGINQEQALIEADKFVELLLKEDTNDLLHYRYE